MLTRPTGDRFVMCTNIKLLFGWPGVRSKGLEGDPGRGHWVLKGQEEERGTGTSPTFLLSCFHHGAWAGRTSQGPWEPAGLSSGL